MQSQYIGTIEYLQQKTSEPTPENVHGGGDAPTPPTPPTDSEFETRIDPEIGRLCIAMRRDAQLRLWALLRDAGAEQGGWMDIERLYDVLCTRSKAYTLRHFKRLVASGEGIFWHIWTEDRIGLVGARKLAAALATDAPQELIETNKPGKPEVVIPTGGDLKTWRSNLYGAWLASRNDPKITRATLSQLFAVSEQTLINWEANNPRIRIASQYGQTILNDDHDADAVMDYLPNNPSVRREFAWDGRTLLTWREPNVYHASYRQTGARFRARKRRYAAKNARPLNHGTKGQRVYFASVKQLRAYNRRRSNKQAGLVWRGESRLGHGIWELTTSDCETGANARARGFRRRQFFGDFFARLRQLREKIASGHFFDPLTGYKENYSAYTEIGGKIPPQEHRRRAGGGRHNKKRKLSQKQPKRWRIDTAGFLG